jgi:hypothetical protein
MCLCLWYELILFSFLKLLIYININIELIDDYVIIGTKQGHLLMYKLEAKRNSLNG